MGEIIQNYSFHEKLDKSTIKSFAGPQVGVLDVLNVRNGRENENLFNPELFKGHFMEFIADHFAHYENGFS